MCRGWLSWWSPAAPWWSWWSVAGHPTSNGRRASHGVRRSTVPSPRYRPPTIHPRRSAPELSMRQPAGDERPEYAAGGVGAVDGDVPTANRGRLASRQARTWSDAIVGPHSRPGPSGRPSPSVRDRGTRDWPTVEDHKPRGDAMTATENKDCLLYTSDAADDLTRVDLGGRRII